MARSFGKNRCNKDNNTLMRLENNMKNKIGPARYKMAVSEIETIIEMVKFQ